MHAVGLIKLELQAVQVQLQQANGTQQEGSAIEKVVAFVEWAGEEGLALRAKGSQS